MPRIPFNVDAYTARLIGRENVSKLEGAVIELVKNTYDADASCCVLYYDETQNALYLADNGSGMTAQTIQNHWMTIGRSSKKGNYISGEGRIQTGEKGIGRFALDRIADKCQMLTGTRNSSGKLLWTVDWTAFSEGRNITEIGAELDETSMGFSEFIQSCSNLQVRRLIEEKWRQNGTIFLLTELRDEWNEQLLHGLKESLASLIPYELSSVYKIYCFNNETTIEDAEVFSDLEAFSYDYKIEFQVSDEQKPVSIKLLRNEYEFGQDEDKILKELGLQKEKKYFHGMPQTQEIPFAEIVPGVEKIRAKALGAFSGVLYFAKRTQTKKDREKFYQKSIAGRADVRDTFGGIKIYRDNFRVRPYGDPKTSAYDWLQLSRRHSLSPAGVGSKGKWTVNADQMLGSVFISRMNVMLPDQSNREGIMETPEFLLLQEFLQGILGILEKDRQYLSRIFSDDYDKKHPAKKIQDDINQKAAQQKKEREKAEAEGKQNQEPSGETVVDAEQAKQALDAKDEQIEELENENKMLRMLATTGIVTNTCIHEFKTLSHKLNLKIVMAKEALEKDEDMEEALSYINEADTIRDGFDSWFQVTIEAVKKDKRKRRKTDIAALFVKSIESWNKVLQPKHIIIEYAGKEKEVYLRCFPYEMETILSNLISNSKASFEKKRVKEKKIELSISEDEEYVRIDYSDTGAGLSPVYKMNPDKTLEVFETDKRDAFGQKIGTGMGLWIVKNTVDDYQGKIDLSENVTAETGYYITLFLKK